MMLTGQHTKKQKKKQQKQTKTKPTKKTTTTLSLPPPSLLPYLIETTLVTAVIRVVSPATTNVHAVFVVIFVISN